ncbi:DUF3833 family protein [Sulfitobacter sp. PS-8MA]|uniref:DUF3833 family protein n=1 Tax=Sulfitobacter sp. PS-8MA TaxID=3237707 RepID=UPI0034C60843
MTEPLIFVLIGLGLGVLLTILRRRFAEFHGQSPSEYIDAFPQFDLRLHLRNKMICEGVIFGPLGRVTSSFTADFDVVWEDNVATVTETFRYNDGSRQNREWTLTLGEDGHFDSTAPDVVGVGKGIQAGPTLQLRYRIRLPEELGSHVLNTVDWMYLTPDGTIVNRSQFRKFGVKVAELVATLRPEEER